MRNRLVAGVCGLALALGALGASGAPARAADVEVVHWLTSSSEAGAIAAVKRALERRGVNWRDAPVAGGGGDAAMTALRARVQAGDPPNSVQLLGRAVTDWAEQGMLLDLGDVAAKENWDAALPPEVQAFSKYENKYVAAPVEMHRTNWMWINRALMEKAGGSEPKTFEELVALLDKFKAIGVVPLAIGGQAWQQAVVFDDIVLSVGGPNFYKAAFVDLDPAALSGDKMIEAFKRLRTLRGYVDPSFTNRDWNLAAAMVSQGKAGMQIIGGWAKGEFISAKQTPGKEIACAAFPGTADSYIFLTDQFAMFEGADKAASLAMASAVMDPQAQREFSMVKGSIPARLDVDMPDVDACGRLELDDRKTAVAGGRLLGSMTFNHAAAPAVVGAYTDVVTNFFNSDQSPEDAVKQLADGVAAAR